MRNTVAEVYNQIMSDLKTATPLLPEVATNVYHPNRTIGYAFQARMFLYMGDYENALTNANEALKLNDQLLDMKPYTTTYSTLRTYRIGFQSGRNLPGRCKQCRKYLYA